LAADVGAGRGRIPAARAGRRAVTWRSTSRSSRPTTASCSANNGRHRDIQPVPQRAPADPGPATPRTTTTCLRPWSGPGCRTRRLSWPCSARTPTPLVAPSTTGCWPGCSRPRPGWPRGGCGRGRGGPQPLRRGGLRRPPAAGRGRPRRYFFRVFAASARLGLVAGASAQDLRGALEREQLAGGTLVGTYQR